MLKSFILISVLALSGLVNTSSFSDNNSRGIVKGDFPLDKKIVSLQRRTSGASGQLDRRRITYAHNSIVKRATVADTTIVPFISKIPPESNPQEVLTAIFSHLCSGCSQAPLAAHVLSGKRFVSAVQEFRASIGDPASFGSVSSRVDDFLQHVTNLPPTEQRKIAAVAVSLVLAGMDGDGGFENILILAYEELSPGKKLGSSDIR